METVALLRFPFLVILNVLSTMCPFQLIDLSMASNRSRNVVKLFNKRFKTQFQLKSSAYYEVAIEKGWNTWAFRITNDKMMDKKMTTCESRSWHNPSWPARRTDTFFKYSENSLAEFMTLCEYVQDLFHLKFEGLSIDLHQFPEHNRILIDWLKTRQDTFEYFEIWSVLNTATDLKYLLDTLKTSQRLAIISELTNDFHTELPDNLDYLYFQDARFVKLEQLLRLTSKRIELWTTNLTNQDINTFLKSWMASECHPDLESLRIGIENEAAMAAILGDIPHEVLDPTDVRVFEGEFDPVHGGYVIQRIDGKSARLAPYPSWRQMFRMFIY